MHVRARINIQKYGSSFVTVFWASFSWPYLPHRITVRSCIALYSTCSRGKMVARLRVWTFRSHGEVCRHYLRHMHMPAAFQLASWWLDLYLQPGRNSSRFTATRQPQHSSVRTNQVRRPESQREMLYGNLFGPTGRYRRPFRPVVPARHPSAVVPARPGQGADCFTLMLIVQRRCKYAMRTLENRFGAQLCSVCAYVLWFDVNKFVCVHKHMKLLFFLNICIFQHTYRRVTFQDKYFKRKTFMALRESRNTPIAPLYTSDI